MHEVKILELSASEEERASTLYENSFVIDCMQGTWEWHPDMPGNFQKTTKAGITAINEPCVDINFGFVEATRNIASRYQWIEQNPEFVQLVRTVEDIHRAKDEKKLGFILGLQNAEPMGKDLIKLRILTELGIKIIGLTYQYSNYLGDGAAELANGGLSTFGMETVEEMNRLGIIVDLSHVGEQTSLCTRKGKSATCLFSRERSVHSQPYAKLHR